MTSQDDSNSQSTSRRGFLKTSTAAGAALLLSGPGHAVHEAPDKIRIGLIGCGGRGTGAAAQALKADPGVTLVAMGDVFKSQIDNSLAALRGEAGLAERIQIGPEHCFVGLDNYRRVIDSGVDVVLLTAPPGFRPAHIEAAVAGGKHIFAEKPMGTDAAGVRVALQAARAAQAKKLAFVSGFCWRYDPARREFYRKIQEGAIGAVRHIHATYLTSPVKPMPPASSRPAGMSDVEWQIRNWYNFVWLSGDGLVEQACHSVDKILWAMKDVPPARCVATGGRSIPNHDGNIYDHIDVFYEWADGARATMAQRQIPCPYSDNGDYIAGASGYGLIKGGRPEIHADTTWHYTGQNKNMYQVEHDELFASIRSGTPINDGERMARSTLMGIMGRMAAYTGQEITWEQMLKSEENLYPANLRWDMTLPIAPMAVPGKTPFV